MRKQIELGSVVHARTDGLYDAELVVVYDAGEYETKKFMLIPGSRKVKQYVLKAGLLTYEVADELGKSAVIDFHNNICSQIRAITNNFKEAKG